MEKEPFTRGPVAFAALPKQTSSTCCQEDSEVIAHIASEDTVGGAAKPLYPQARDVLCAPGLCVGAVQPTGYTSEQGGAR